eukprot:Plantae.Rhodophyta-Hildenbrandia_rubra.ctg732.p1 GENE.Plantae.Rhodophyta-Hildenbrandia_rubra.ctg732~~Plantae.Rhodophyta-Hildenbrandia_rubra.ctg732.p1  ORF type:complete len:352 (-),score=61.48 Plantae.Rhodophyta-Hildenbrandia_rubra.ctg732:218-1273(-)
MISVVNSVGFAGLFTPLPKLAVNRSSHCKSRVLRCSVSKPTIITHVPPAKSVKLGSDEFREKVTGEWAGYEVAFDAKTGDALDIPEILVPREFRDYGLRVLGFDVRSSCSVNTDGTALVIKRTRALPTVGCEADAVITDVKENVYLREHALVFEDGSFTIGDSEVKKDSKFVFGLARAKERVRIEFQGTDFERGTITMFREKWDAQWCNGEILPGCGGGVSSFGEEEKKDYAEELVGKWTIRLSEQFRLNDTWTSEVGTLQMDRTERQADEEVIVSLPHGVTVGMLKSSSNVLTIHVGALYETGSRLVLGREYRDGQLERVMHRYETKDSPLKEDEAALLVEETELNIAHN